MDSYWDKKHIIESILSNDNICIGERLDLVIEFLKLCKQDPVIIHERDPCPLQHFPSYPILPDYPITNPWISPSYEPGTIICSVNGNDKFLSRMNHTID